MIRKAVQKDSINLAALSIQVWLDTYAYDGIRKEISSFVLKTFTEDYFNRLIDDPAWRCLVCIESDHLVGYILLNLESIWQDASNGYEIDKLYVQAPFQGNGIGKQLLTESERLYGSRFWLSTWIHNEKAINFYKHLGFMDVGHIYFELDENERHENRILTFKGGLTKGLCRS